MNNLSTISQPSELSLYIHVPYCEFACHYCDFAKTANFTNKHSSDFFYQCQRHLTLWFDKLQLSNKESSFASVFVGGGTPSLYTRQFQFLTPYLKCDESTIEVNPNHCTPTNLTAWKQLGFNRLSIGVQTFNNNGLAVLTRQHDQKTALQAIANANKEFANVSVDLIYGWPGQTFEDLRADLKILSQLSLTHISCYNLIYEPGTPFHRMLKRGKFNETDENQSDAMYTLLCDELGKQRYGHYEVSNWAKDGFESIHNKRYWNGSYYLAVGPGAHGFLPSSEMHGIRYSYPKSDRIFNRMENITEVTIDQRDSKAWVHELILSGLRSKMGVDMAKINIAGFDLKMSPQIVAAFSNKILSQNNNRLYLVESEWFREHAWVMIVIESLVEKRGREKGKKGSVT